MLHEEPFTQKSLELIADISVDPALKSFVLAGGTALALQLGHRKTNDIDLFSLSDIDSVAVAKHLEATYGGEIASMTRDSVSSKINGIRTNVIVHPYEYIAPLVVSDDVRMASLDDLGAMKLHAIVNNGKRVQDFIDMHFLLEHRSLDDLTNAYLLKYPSADVFLARTGLLFHDDVKTKNHPEILYRPFNWDEINKRLRNAVASPRAIFKYETELNKRIDEPKIVQPNQKKGKRKRL